MPKNPHTHISSNHDDGSVLVELNKEIYHRDAVLKASNKFTDKCFVLVAPTNEYNVGVTFRSKENINIDLEKVALEFCNEVTDQQIREDLAKSNQQIREVIYSHAFTPIKDIENAIKK